MHPHIVYQHKLTAQRVIWHHVPGSVQMMLLCYGWDRRTFQMHPTSMTYIWDVWAPSTEVGRHIKSFSNCTPPQTYGQMWVSWLTSHLQEVCKWCHYAMVEAVEPFKQHPISMSYIYKVFEHLLLQWISIWMYPHIIHHHKCWVRFRRVGWHWGSGFEQMKWCHYALAEAVEPFKQHPTSMPSIYPVFEQLLLQLIGIWMHPHIVYHPKYMARFGRVGWHSRSGSVWMMPLRYGWRCRTLQKPPGTHIIHL